MITNALGPCIIVAILGIVFHKHVFFNIMITNALGPCIIAWSFVGFKGDVVVVYLREGPACPQLKMLKKKTPIGDLIKCEHTNTSPFPQFVRNYNYHKSSCYAASEMIAQFLFYFVCL